MASIIVQVSALLLNLLAIGLAVAESSAKQGVRLVCHDSGVATGSGVGAPPPHRPQSSSCSPPVLLGRWLKPGGSRACALMLFLFSW
ncbi:hypothetical protein ZWY2020_022972 [Hordeum vulgare]|nr:hypothetical protein ZWY2020_022972 [Hordeum vulgare]